MKPGLSQPDPDVRVELHGSSFNIRLPLLPQVHGAP
jgi:hypothetical protein